jgi:hypothetical protein
VLFAVSLPAESSVKSLEHEHDCSGCSNLISPTGRLVAKAKLLPGQTKPLLALVRESGSTLSLTKHRIPNCSCEGDTHAISFHCCPYLCFVCRLVLLGLFSWFVMARVNMLVKYKCFAAKCRVHYLSVPFSICLSFLCWAFSKYFGMIMISSFIFLERGAIVFV